MYIPWYILFNLNVCNYKNLYTKAIFYAIVYTFAKFEMCVIRYTICILYCTYSYIVHTYVHMYVTYVIDYCGILLYQFLITRGLNRYEIADVA